jgi:hypothetical protein
LKLRFEWHKNCSNIKVAFVNTQKLIVCREEVIIRLAAAEEAPAIKVTRVLDKQLIVENPAITGKPAENHLCRKRKTGINLLTETRV